MNNQKQTRVTADLDFDRGGIQTGALRIPYSHDRDAYGYIPVPLMVAKNGSGPTVLLTGANHGDEVEGSAALMSLMRNMDVKQLRGRLIIIPGLNFPAYLNSSRTSPIDHGNLNRLFPGDPDGSPTSVLAHYIGAELMPRADYVMDFHSGGTTMAYVPTLFLSRPSDQVEEQKAEAIIEAFGAPRLMYMDNLASDQMIGSVARRHGAYLITGEFGGGGGVNLDGLAVAKRGIAGVLDKLGVLPAPDLNPAPRTRRYRFRPEHYAFAPLPGIFEPACRLGDRVVAGQLAGLIYDPYRPWSEPERVHFQADGELFCLRTVARVDAGNFLAHLAEEEPQ
jgi:uncharacterized protein